MQYPEKYINLGCSEWEGFSPRLSRYQCMSGPTPTMISQLYPTCALAALLVWLLLSLVQCFRSPLTKIPGPTYTSFTNFYLMVQEFTSNRRPYIHLLHQKYGPAVRLSPNEVSFTSLDALNEVYTSRGSGYDKTGFYTLFMQFKTKWVEALDRVDGDWYWWLLCRTMFSTLGKGDVNCQPKLVVTTTKFGG